MPNDADAAQSIARARAEALSVVLAAVAEARPGWRPTFAVLNAASGLASTLAVDLWLADERAKLAEAVT